MWIASRRGFLQGCAALAAGSSWLRSLAAAAVGLEEKPDSAPPGGTGLALLGKVAARPSATIAASPLGVGFETLDRQMFVPERTYQHLAQLGVKWARCQTGWARTETRPGAYDFAWLDSVVDALRKIGVQPWFNLGYGNRLYTPDAADATAVGWAPVFSPEAREAWARYTRAIAQHYRDRVQHWEIWNEPNIKSFWQPRNPSPDDYVELVKLTAPIITQRVPNAVIVAGAFSRMPTEYLQRCLELGLGDYVHKVSYHPYRAIPEGECTKSLTAYEREVAQWRELLRKHKPGLELWQGENGAPSQDGTAGALSQYHWTETRQAKWVTRRILSDLRLKLELTSYFHMVDMVNYVTTKGPSGKTNFKGLLRGSDYTPKLSYFAYQCLCALFDAQTVRVDLPLELPTAETAKAVTAAFVRNGRPIYAYWLPADLNEQIPTRPIDITIPDAKQAPLTDPVLIDPLTAGVHRLASAKQQGGAWKITAPVADYPLLLADRRVM